jgi:hypothetical protein
MRWIDDFKSRPRCEMRELMWASVLTSLLILAAIV